MNFPNNGFPAQPFPGFQNPNPFSPPGQSPQGFPGGFAGQQPQYPAPGGFGAPQQGQPFAQPQRVDPSQLGGMFQGMGSADTQGDRLPPLPLGGHERVRVSNCRAERSTMPGEQHIVYFRADLTVVESKSAAPGTRANFQVKLTGHQYGAADDMARLRQLVAAAYGKDPNAAETRAEFDAQANQIMSAVLAGAIEGKEVAVLEVTHSMTKPRANRPSRPFGKYTFGKVGSQVTAAPVQAAAAVAQAPTWPPAGWVATPGMPGHYTGNYQGQVVTVSENNLRVAQASGQI